MVWRLLSLCALLALATNGSCQAASLFESGSWTGFENYDATGCIMISPFPDRKTAIAVEMVDSEDIMIGIRWIEKDFSSLMGQDINGRLFVDNRPPIVVTGRFERKDYLRFYSVSRGLLKHVFTAGRAMRLEYGDGAWFTSGLRGTSKAVDRLAVCAERQKTLAQFATNQNSEVGEATAPTADTEAPSAIPSFVAGKGSLVNQQSMLSISLGDLITKEKLEAVFPKTKIDFQMYPEDGECPDGCYSVSYEDKSVLDVFLKVTKTGNLLGFSFSGSAVSDYNGNKTGELFSQIKAYKQISCDFGYYTICSGAEGEVTYLDPDMSCDIKDAFGEGTESVSILKQPDCLKITSFHFGDF